MIRAACEATAAVRHRSATTRGGFGDTPPVLEVERRAAELFGVGRRLLLCHRLRRATTCWRLLTDGPTMRSSSTSFALLRVRGRAGSAAGPCCRFHHCDAGDLAAPLSETCGRASARWSPATACLPRGARSRRWPTIATCCATTTARPCRSTTPTPWACWASDGRGTLEHAGLWPPGSHLSPTGRGAAMHGPSLYACGTLSKAVGGFGGIMPGSRAFVGPDQVAVALLRRRQRPARRLPPRPRPGPWNWSWPTRACGRGCGRTSGC